ncbi:response regulator [Pelagibius marinus]|uniref:response regulator n=1 Tax=Pelagibius marinus TaxID=2762760 RepID=UPI001872AC8F|nr:response regulator [Pelagibius marinus]
MPSSPSANTRDQAPSLDGKVIVLLEDDELVRRATERMLTRFGAVVITGASSAEVLAAISDRKLTPSCVIADYWLSHDEDGLTAARVVREAAGSPVQGLIVTGDLSDEVASNVAEAGFRLLRKPVNVDSFLDAISINS